MRVIEKVDITESLFQLTLDPEHLGSSFQIPGQYVVITIENLKPIYLVIASYIGSANWSFLIRDANPGTNFLKNMQVGDSIAVSTAQGKGFPIEKLKNKNILLLTAGTGLAAIYSVMGQLIKTRSEYQKIILMHGSRYEEELPFRNEMLEWVKQEAEVFVTLSQPNDEWAFYEGHVQEILKHEAIDLSDYVSLICGPNQMIKDVSELAFTFGLKKENIFTNY